MRDHRKLRAFVLADELANQIYRLTQKFPKEAMYGLTSQMRRAAVSVPSNIVEGCTREGEVEYLRFPEISFGSLRELHYQLSLAQRLGYCDQTPFLLCDSKSEETEKVFASLIRSIRQG